VANLGANLWGHSQDGKTASIRAGRIHYQARMVPPCRPVSVNSAPVAVIVICRAFDIWFGAHSAAHVTAAE
jgi:hypothetical protein